MFIGIGTSSFMNKAFPNKLSFLQVRSGGSPLSPFLYPSASTPPGGGGSQNPSSHNSQTDPITNPPPAHMGAYLDKSGKTCKNHLNFRVFLLNFKNLKVFLAWIWTFTSLFVSRIAATPDLSFANGFSISLLHAWGSRSASSLVSVTR